MDEIDLPADVLEKTRQEFYKLEQEMPYLIRHRQAEEDLTREKEVLELGDREFFDFVLRHLVDSYELHVMINFVHPAGLPLNSSVLQVGCNYAPYLKYLQERRPDLKLTGIDLSEYGVNFGRSYGGLDLRLMDAFNMGFPDATFDFVLNDYFLDESYLRDPGYLMLEKGISEVYRVLKPGGKFFSKAIHLDERRLEKVGFKVSTYATPDMYIHGNSLIAAEK